MNKKILAVIRLEDGVQKAMAYERMGADEVILLSPRFEDEELLIKTIKSICTESDCRLRVYQPYKRLEDVKKILYAGAAGVIIYPGNPMEKGLMEAAVDRFGADKVGFAVQTDVHYMLPDKKITVYTDFPNYFTSAVKYQFAAGEDTVKVLTHNTCDGAILPESAEVINVHQLKRELKAQGCAVQTFESSLPFDTFKLDEQGLIPVIVQDYKTAEVLMMAYMNKESFEQTVQTGLMTYWSRSRQELWCKGDTSGHYQYVKSLDIDCDKDTILAKVEQLGAACHTGNRSCFYTNLLEKPYDDRNPMMVFENVMSTITDRKAHPKEGSYTNYLFDQGIDKILKKVGEEATEIVIAAKNPDTDEIKYEICDFLYHAMVLMAERGVTWKEIAAELAERH